MSRRRSRARRRRKRRNRAGRIIVCFLCFFAVCFCLVLGLYSRLNAKDFVGEYVAGTYSGSLYEGELFADDLCVSSGNVSLDGFSDDSELSAVGLFNLETAEVVYGYNLYTQVYPASTTKLVTAYTALKYGSLDDVVTVSDVVNSFAADEVVCGLAEGDTLTLYDLLCGLLLVSGNDCASVIAEYISGSTEAFADLMNEEALALGMTGSHFVNPHGLHDEDHYTTAYDLYLVFNACVQNDTFLEIISMDSYDAEITGADGTIRTAEWLPTNYYSLDVVNAPSGIRVFGGKTGTTDAAGNCVILYAEDTDANPYISVIMGAPSRDYLYEQMNALYEAGT